MKERSAFPAKRPHVTCPLLLPAVLFLMLSLTGMPVLESPVAAPPANASPPPASETPGLKKPPPFRSEPARGKFLIAAQTLIDPNFAETVVLLIDNGPHGAMGIVINRPTRIRLSEIIPDIEGLKDRQDRLYTGGPVQRDRLMMLIKSAQPPEAVHAILEDVYIGAKPEFIEKIIDRADPEERFRAYAGYAGWSPGQLDREVARGDWHILRADPATIFDKAASKIWPDLIRYFTSKWVKSGTPAGWHIGSGKAPTEAPCRNSGTCR